MLYILDINLDEVGQTERVGGLLQRVAPLEVGEETFEVHGQISSQLLDQFVHVTHIDEIEAF